MARSHRLADAVKGGQLKYMALAMEREQTAYRSLLMVASDWRAMLQVETDVDVERGFI